MQPEPMNPDLEAQQMLDARIVAALECAPEVAIPEGFAARVAAQLPGRRVSVYRPAQIRRSRFGVTAATAGMVALAIIMLAFAPRVETHGLFWKLMEWTFCAEFCALAGWLGLGRREAE